MIRDKDMLDFQYSEAIREVCASCTEGEGKGIKETMKEVKKVWGKELWVVNCSEYCGKLLYLDKGAESSYHYHKEKQETFYSLKGQTALTIEGKDYMLNPYSRPKTIKLGQLHGFRGISDSLILEISTHHDDKDVYRISESKQGRKI